MQHKATQKKAEFFRKAIRKIAKNRIVMREIRLLNDLQNRVPGIAAEAPPVADTARR